MARSDGSGTPRRAGTHATVPASLASTYEGAPSRARVRVGFALTHPTVVAGLALGADVPTGVVGAALLALHGLVELQWHLADRSAAAGLPVRASYTGPS